MVTEHFSVAKSEVELVYQAPKAEINEYDYQFKRVLSHEACDFPILPFFLLHSIF